MLRFSPAAWRRFAGSVKRSLASDRACPAGPGKGHSPGRGCPFGVSGAVPCGPEPGRDRSVGAGACRFRLWRVGVVCESVVVRAARPRVGGGGRGSGGTGNRAFGGSGFSRCLQLPPAEAAVRYARIAVRSAAPCALPTATRTGFALHFPGHLYGGPPRVALQLPRSLVWWGPPSVRFRIGPPWCLVLAE